MGNTGINAEFWIVYVLADFRQGWPAQFFKLIGLLGAVS